MGRAAVRAAAQSYLTNQNLPFVGKVFSARPLIIDENDYDAKQVQWLVNQAPPADDTLSSSVIVINIPNTKRERRSLTGRGSVDDTNVHSFVLEVFFANQSGDALQAQADCDSVVDAIQVAIRTDPLLGQPSVVWSAGEFDAGVETEQTEPFTSADGTTIFIVSTVRFQTWEWVSGTGV